MAFCELHQALYLHSSLGLKDVRHDCVRIERGVMIEHEHACLEIIDTASAEIFNLINKVVEHLEDATPSTSAERSFSPGENCSRATKTKSLSEIRQFSF